MVNFFKKNWLSIALFLIILIGIASMAYEKGVTKQLRKSLNEKERVYLENISGKQLEIDRLHENNLEIKTKILELGEKFDTFAAEKAEWKEREKELEKKAYTAPPEHLIVDLKRILDTDEIWQVTDGILFSIESVRKLSSKLYDWEDFTLKREPIYLEEISTYKTNVYLLNQEIRNLNSEIQNTNDIVKAQEAFNRELKEYLSKRDRASFMDSVRKIGTGIAIGATTAFLIKELKK